MRKSLVAVIVLGSIAHFGTAHAQMPEPTPPEQAPPIDQPAAPPAAQPQAEPPAPAVEPPPQTFDGEAPEVRPPSSYAAAPPPARQVGVVDTYRDGTPPLSGGRLVGEALVGGLFAAGGAIGGAYLGYSMETGNGCSSDLCGLGGVILGGVAGLAFVTPVGVYLVGNTNDQTGSLAATVGGSVIGTLVGVAAVAAAENEASTVLLIAGPVVGSMIGFNVTRKYAPGHKARNWVPVANVSQGNTSVGVVGRF